MVEFHTVGTDSGLNQPALIDVFLNSLSETLNDCLAPLDFPAELKALIKLASDRDKRLFERQQHRVQENQYRFSSVSKQRV